MRRTSYLHRDNCHVIYGNAWHYRTSRFSLTVPLAGKWSSRTACEGKEQLAVRQNRPAERTQTGHARDGDPQFRQWAVPAVLGDLLHPGRLLISGVGRGGVVSGTRYREARTSRCARYATSGTPSCDERYTVDSQSSAIMTTSVTSMNFLITSLGPKPVTRTASVVPCGAARARSPRRSSD